MKNLSDFQHRVWEYYGAHGRHLPWRVPEPDGSIDAYKVLVSEIMLQQTQVGRVTPKYEEFLRRFPNVKSLADAPLADVLRLWSGLGYNRRAKYLHDAAKHFAQGPTLSQWEVKELVACKGIGINTARAVVVYAYNQPLVFIETNIRSVFIYHFCHNDVAVDDKKILPLVEENLDTDRPREWYWALMDYGTHLKQTTGNNVAQSRHYVRQPPFKGSRRHIRGQVLRLLAGQPRQESDLASAVADNRLAEVLRALTAEGLIHLEAGYYRL